MDTCPNCNAFISCGCQRRTATDGKAVCTNCLEEYEQQLVFKKSQELAQTEQQADLQWAYNQINK
jgi:hypothetical protein